MSLPTTSPDIEAWLIGLFDAALEPVKAYNVKPGTANAHLVVRADLQNKVTRISRYCRVGIQAWVVDAAGNGDLGASFDLAAAAGRVLESARTGPVLAADVDSGPTRVTDSLTGVEYHFLTALLEVAV